jgi:prepilin-type processing-associated H-X9-DG protein/prepilin-type N-terminal cleavage/methylation domain-containing protein
MRDKAFCADQRRAFTILELLVVVAIIGVLVGILFPALMAARESARCMQCKNNLREVGVAIQQHHDAVKKFPEAWKAAPDKISGFGWAVALLPYLEESSLAKNINSRLPVSAPQNDATRSIDLPIMRCPSDISDPTFELLPESVAPGAHAMSTKAHSAPDPNVSLVRLPSANYLGVFGTLEADETFPAPAGDGPIVFNRTVRIADLQRGTNHTIIVGERSASMVPSTWYGVNFKGEDAACRLVGSAITSPNCEPCDECEFGSRHSGGSNFAWADGHVTLVHNDIDRTEYQQLSKRRMN